MYTGSLIDELFATVANVEARAEQRGRQTDEPAELERWYARLHEVDVHVQLNTQSNLLGVA